MRYYFQSSQTNKINQQIIQMKLNDIINGYYPKVQHKNSQSELSVTSGKEKKFASFKKGFNVSQQICNVNWQTQPNKTTAEKTQSVPYFDPCFIKNRKVYELNPQQAGKQSQLQVNKEKGNISFTQNKKKQSKTIDVSQGSQFGLKQFLSQNTSDDSIRSQSNTGNLKFQNNFTGHQHRNKTYSAFYNNSFQQSQNNLSSNANKFINYKSLDQAKKLLQKSMKSYRDLQDNVKREQNINQDLKNQLSLKDRQLVDLRIQNNKNKCQLETKRKKINEIHQILDQKQNTFHEMSKQNRTLKINLETLQKQVEHSQSSIIDVIQKSQAKQFNLSQEIYNLKSNCSKIQQKYDNKCEQYQFLRKNEEILKGKIKTLEKSLQSKKNQLQQFKNKSGQTIKLLNIAKHQENLKIKQKDASQKKQIWSKFQQMKINLQEQLSNSQKIRKDLKLKVQNLNLQIQDLKKQIQQRDKYFQIQRYNFEETIQKSQEHSLNLQNRINQMKLQNQKYMELLKNQNQQEVIRADKKYIFYQSMNEQLNRDIQFRKQLEIKYVSEIKQHRAQIIKNQSLIQNLKFQLHKLEQDIGKNQRQLKNAKSEKEQIFRKTIQQSNRIKELELTLEKVRLQCSKIKELTRIQYEQLLSKKDYEHNNYKRNTDNIIANLKLDIEKATQNNQYTKSEIETLQKRIISLNQIISKYKSQIFEGKQTEIKMAKLLQQSNLTKNEQIQRLQSEIDEQKVQLTFLGTKYKNLEQQLRKKNKLQITLPSTISNNTNSQPKFEYFQQKNQDKNQADLRSELQAKNLKLIVLRSNCKTLEMERQKCMEIEKEMFEQLQSKDQVINEMRQSLAGYKQIVKNLKNKLEKCQISDKIRGSNLSQIIYENYQELLTMFNIIWDPLFNREVPQLQIISCIQNIQKQNQFIKKNHQLIQHQHNKLVQQYQAIYQKFVKAEKSIHFQSKLFEIINQNYGKQSIGQIQLKNIIENINKNNQSAQQTNYENPQQNKIANGLPTISSKK